MEKRKNHIQLLIHFAKVDNHFDERERQFIRQVGKRIELKDEEIETIMNSQINDKPPIPESEVQRYIIIDDLLNLVAIDKKITPEEENEVKSVAEEFGFPSSMVDEIIEKLKRHIELGFDTNQISHSVKNSVFSLNNKATNDKYDIQ